jgi:hypothetical protein
MTAGERIIGHHDVGGFAAPTASGSLEISHRPAVPPSSSNKHKLP